MSEVVGYLSQIIVDEITAIKNRLINPYEWHKTIWKLFQDKNERDFLFHIDSSRNPLKGLILSRSLPTVHSPFQIETKPLYQSFFSASTYQFEICCNPTQKKRTYLEDGTRKKNGTRLGIVNREQAEEWLRNKGELGGFQIKFIEEVNYDLLKFNKGQNPITLAAVTFKGILHVTDQNKFLATVLNGIGSAKGLGFGLFKIIPIQDKQL